MNIHENRKALWLAVLTVGLLVLGGTSLEAAKRSPELTFSTYLGGSREDFGVAIKQDYMMGQLHVAGSSASEDFPGGGFYPFFRTDVFLVTFSGNRVVNTGFFNFPGNVFPFDLTPGGPYLYLVGTEVNTDYAAGFASRFNPWNPWNKYRRFLPSFEPFKVPPMLYGSTYSSGTAAAADWQGNLYAAGTVRFTDQNHRYQSAIVVAKLTPELDPIWVRAVNGLPEDWSVKIAVDGATGSSYVSGITSFSLPVTPGTFQGSPGGGRDGFVLKLGPSGAVEYLTYLGGSGQDAINDIAVTPDGSAVVVGETSSADFPVREALQPALQGGQDSFVAKLTPDGSGLVFSTYLGGSQEDGISAVSLSLLMDSIFVAGTTGSSDYPQVKAVPRPCAPAPGLCGPSDAFITELAPDGSAVLFSTLLGGSGSDSGADLVVSIPYEVALTGSTNSPDFPLVDPVQAAFAGASDAFVAVLKVPNEPPDCASAQASPALLWPPNGQLVPASIAVPDPDGDRVTLRVYDISQDEPLSGTTSDAAGIGTPTPWVRADRQGGGDGRVYRIGFEARDELGALCTGRVTLCVPHDRRPGTGCQDSGVRYSSSQ